MYNRCNYNQFRHQIACFTNYTHTVVHCGLWGSRSYWYVGGFALITTLVHEVTYAPERGPHGSTLSREGSNIESILIVVYVYNRHTILCLGESVGCEWDLD